MIAISRLKFPYGISGRDLDAFARAPLWAAGQDFNHGTGHGVGHFLSVHEGPQRLSRASTVVLEPGMILSNEPGFYKEGAFGIRIENLLSVGVADLPEAANLTRLLEFETLTHVPIDLRMVISDWLDPSEKAWINAYHQKCWNLHQDQLSSSAAQWLGHATKAL
jgi:Xaa-Pro aminopeptidase